MQNLYGTGTELARNHVPVPGPLIQQVPATGNHSSDHAQPRISWYFYLHVADMVGNLPTSGLLTLGWFHSVYLALTTDYPSRSVPGSQIRPGNDLYNSAKSMARSSTDRQFYHITHTLATDRKFCQITGGTTNSAKSVSLAHCSHTGNLPITGTFLHIQAILPNHRHTVHRQTILPNHCHAPPHYAPPHTGNFAKSMAQPILPIHCHISPETGTSAKSQTILPIHRHNKVTGTLLHIQAILPIHWHTLHRQTFLPNHWNNQCAGQGPPGPGSSYLVLAGTSWAPGPPS